jgi:hypothetical protein
LQADEKTLYAVVRSLEIISEASRRLTDEVKARHANIEWREMAAAGNVYRHSYEDVTARRLEDVARSLAGLADCSREGAWQLILNSETAARAAIFSEAFCAHAWRIIPGRNSV